MMKIKKISETEVQGSNAQAALKLVRFIITFLLSSQAVFRISDNALNVFFKFFKILIKNEKFDWI